MIRVAGTDEQNGEEKITDEEKLDEFLKELKPSSVNK